MRLDLGWRVLPNAARGGLKGLLGRKDFSSLMAKPCSHQLDRVRAVGRGHGIHTRRIQSWALPRPGSSNVGMPVLSYS